jgi:hypothetical protein
MEYIGKTCLVSPSSICDVLCQVLVRCLFELSIRAGLEHNLFAAACMFEDALALEVKFFCPVKISTTSLQPCARAARSNVPTRRLSEILNGTPPRMRTVECRTLVTRHYQVIRISQPLIQGIPELTRKLVTSCGSKAPQRGVLATWAIHPYFPIIVMGAIQPAERIRAPRSVSCSENLNPRGTCFRFELGSKFVIVVAKRKSAARGHVELAHAAVAPSRRGVGCRVTPNCSCRNPFQSTCLFLSFISIFYCLVDKI